jgi:hypothetical protein
MNCRSLSTAESRVEIECPVCDGDGCEECNDGVFELDGCPNSFCSPIVRSLDLFDLFEKGLPPVAGGVLDQSQSFVEASQFFESEEGKVKHERSSRNPD